ncbi:hypothetical protein D0862_09103 [Hortaea werneckii]|uniref:Protein BNI4 n=1 Tax=Hortaea werneckii TaxID=91943 RepID=A0A3M7FYC6_HORWE|nr:hypothetical protein D0862_09103 [Hortaea werneckii]
MAEVLSPPMQTSSTIPMLHSRPSSADAFQTSPQQYQQSPRLGQTPRSMYNGATNTSFRGTAASPAQAFAFQSPPHPRSESRTSSAPNGAVNGDVRHSMHGASASTSSSETASGPSSKDDSVVGSRSGSLINISSTVPDLSLTSFDTPAKASPDRYRRPAQKRGDSNTSLNRQSAQPSGSGMGAVNHLYQQQSPVLRQTSVDDMAVTKKESESAKRYRRRSLNNLDVQSVVAPQSIQRPASGHGPSATSTPTTIRPVSFQSQTSSEDGVQRNGSQTSLQKTESGKDSVRSHENTRPAAQKPVSIPPRGSSDANKRLAAPSPLSRSAVDNDQSSPAKPKTYAAAAQPNASSASPAAAQLAAVSDKDLNKGMKSRLRRAFSFGSAQELRRAAGENQHAAAAAATNATQTREQHHQHIDEELDAEQLEIARRQEEAGIGAGIYSGQGGFSGSMDNLSISSTASSASMMLRKMGRGVKKGGKSIKGIFRPKSVIGVPAADGPVQVGSGSATVQPSVGHVSMVTVEAERQKVNVNADPTESIGGETGFPKLERNSVDAGRKTSSFDARGSGDAGSSADSNRRSIVGSDKDRAEVLAAVKKGILKRSGSGSPNGSPGVGSVPQLSDSATGGLHLPGTPKEGTSSSSSHQQQQQMQQMQQRRSASFNDAVKVGDYFTQRMIARSVPGTPNGAARSISFSPRIQFHDVWSSQEYDRRGDIATCNRLTPMLAQQIKEELNTFKMEMEVHEMSKPHTHFF